MRPARADDAGSRAAEQAARDSYGRLVSILSARTRDIAAAEDALGEAFAAALRVWPERGVPDNPDAWLITAARNHLSNIDRGTAVRARAEPELILRSLSEDEENGFGDDRLRLMFVCAHPAIDAAARTPLILQTVLGLDAARIAQAFVVPAATMSQRLVRAKARIRDAGLRFSLPDPEVMPERLGDVLDAIYAAFGQGWDGLERPEAPDGLTGEAIWLARLLVALLKDEPEPKGLLALMLYTTARRDARRDCEGRFVPLDAQDARRWNRNMIIEAEGLLTIAAQAGRFGRYQCEAAIQSVHIQRPITGHLNLPALRTLYDLLVEYSDSLGAHISRAVVLAKSGEAQAALEALDGLPHARIEQHQSWWVARAEVLQALGRSTEAESALARAIALTKDQAIRTWLEARRGR